MERNSDLRWSPRTATVLVLQWLVFAILMSSASLLLIVRRVGDASFYALLLLAIIIAACGIRPAGMRFTELLKRYWPIHLAMAGQFIAIFVHQAVTNDFNSRVYDLPSRMALFPVLLWAALLVPYRLLRHARWALALGAILAAVKMGLLTDWGTARKNTEFIPVIAFAEMAMALGFLSLLTLAWQESAPMRRIANSVKLIAGAAGVYAAYLSQTRGAWISIPGLLFVTIFVLKGSRRSFRVQLSWFLAATILLGCLFASSHIARDRMSLAQSETADYFAGKSRDTSVGTRFQLWQGSWLLFTEHPAVGIGMDSFQSAMRGLSQQGIITEEASKFPHSHNEILYNLTTLGLVGLIGILALYLVPIKYFAQRLDRNDSEARAISGMGIILCFGFFSFGLVDVMFMWRSSDNFYALIMVLIFACSIRQKHERAIQSESLCQTKHS